MNHRTARYLQIALGVAACISVTAAFAQIVVSTAEPGNTYDLMAQQFATACGNYVNGPIITKPSGGSMENVDRLLNNEVQAAIVQTDVMSYRAIRDDLSRLKALFVLHPEEVHILALSATRKFGGLPGIGRFMGPGGTPFNTLADLRDRDVGAWGGSVVTAQVIRLQAEVGFRVVEFPDQNSALRALTDKTIDALISVAGAPQPWVQRLDTRFRLVPIADAEAMKLKHIYRPARVTYGNLRQTGVATVATDAVLVVRDYRTPALATMLVQLRNCLHTRLFELQETPGNHASWQKVRLDVEPKILSYVAPTPDQRGSKKVERRVAN